MRISGGMAGFKMGCLNGLGNRVGKCAYFLNFPVFWAFFKINRGWTFICPTLFFAFNAFMDIFSQHYLTLIFQTMNEQTSKPTPLQQLKNTVKFVKMLDQVNAL